MSRAPTAADPIPVRPGNNIYTVLVIVATLVNLLALLVLFFKYNAVFGGWPFSTSA